MSQTPLKGPDRKPGNDASRPETKPGHASRSSSPRRWSWGSRRLACLYACLFLIGVFATAFRTVRQYQTPGPFDENRQGYCDFHNGIYFPAMALFHGVSPFSQEYADSYPVSRQLPFFSPVIFAAHSPLLLIPLHASEVIYFVFSAALVILIAWLIVAASQNGSERVQWRLSHVMMIAAVIVFSRSGHITLFNGYFTLLLVLATFAAIHFAGRKTWVSVIALVIAACKPTFILPLGFLMLARGNVRELIFGALVSIVTTGAIMTWLASNYAGDEGLASGFQVLTEQISNAHEVHRGMDDERPSLSWTRLDALAVYAKWTRQDPDESAHMMVMMVLLAPGMWLLHRRRQQGVDDGLVGLTGAIVLSYTLATIYHQSYDALLLVPVVFGVWLSWTNSRTSNSRIASQHQIKTSYGHLLACGILLFPAFNYLSTRAFLGRFVAGESMVIALTSASGIAVCMACVMVSLMEMRRIASVSQ